MPLFIIASGSLVVALIAVALLRGRAARHGRGDDGSPRRFRFRDLLLVFAIFVVVLVLVASIALFFGGVSGAPPHGEVGGTEGFGGLILFAAMLTGMAAKTLWDAIEARRGAGALQIDYWSFVKPACVSPIVFALLWQQMEEKLGVLALCFAFQNGFMWQTLLGRAVRTDSPARTRRPPSPK